MPSLLDRLHPGLKKRIAEKGWNGGLLPIQKKAIPHILAGRDCMIEAPTAGGKTEAVLFPTLTKAAETGGGGVRILYIAPLRALLNNLELRGIEYAEACGLDAFKWHGDVDQQEKLKKIRQPPTLLMTTPESLEAILLRKSNWALFFEPLSSIIIDEAHNFAFGDRGGHLLSVLERVCQAAQADPQRIALTATVGNPEDLAEWLAGNSRKSGIPISITDKSTSQDFVVHLFDSEADDPDDPQQLSYYRQFIALQDLVRNSKNIVFAKSRSQTESLAKAFLSHKGSRGLPIEVRTHHSAVSKFFREEAERLIQTSSETGINAILSTSTLELGIDIGNLDKVMQMGALASSSSFLQRVGRTGRRPGRSQFFRGLCTDRKDLLLLTATVNLGLRRIPEKIIFPRRAFHLMAHQLLCLSLQMHGITTEQAWGTLSKGYCFAGIVRDEFDKLVDFMVDQDYLRPADGVLVVGEATEKTFLGAGWKRLFAVFETAPLYEVYDQKNHVGTLDASFVEMLSTPFLFVLGGLLWKAKKVDYKAHIVKAVRAPNATAPVWNCFGIPDVPFETAQEVGRILHSDDEIAFLDEEAAGVLRDMQFASKARPWVPGRVVAEISNSGSAELVTYAGDRINRALARLVTALEIGEATSNYVRVKFSSTTRDGAELEKMLKGLVEKTRSGDLCTMNALTEKIAEITRPLRFSPFICCLPEDLWTAAQIERTMDCEGLLRITSESEFVWIRSKSYDLGVVSMTDKDARRSTKTT